MKTSIKSIECFTNIFGYSVCSINRKIDYKTRITRTYYNVTPASTSRIKHMINNKSERIVSEF